MEVIVLKRDPVGLAGGQMWHEKESRVTTLVGDLSFPMNDGAMS